MNKMKPDALVFMDRARQELAKITTIDEAKTIRDKAEVLRIYAKKIGKGLEIQNQCAEIKIRAERKAGELIPKQIKIGGDRKSKTHNGFLKLSNLGIDDHQSSRWQLMASIPEDLFEQFIAEIKEKIKELTSFNTIKFATKLKRDKYWKETEKKGKKIILPKEIPIVEKDFRKALESQQDDSVDLIFTDPPYNEKTIKDFGDLAKIAKRILKPKGSLLTYVGHYAIPEVLNLMIPHLKFWWILAIKHTGPSARLPGKWIFVEWKPMLWFVKDGRRDNRYIADLFESKNPTKELHDWEQDLSEAEYYIKQLTYPGDLVLDPFCGLATTLIAAHKNNRRVLGIEKDNKTLLRAKVRISEYLKEEKLNGKA